MGEFLFGHGTNFLWSDYQMLAEERAYFTTPVLDPHDYTKLRDLVTRTHRTVGAIQALKVSAFNLENGMEKRFTNVRVPVTIHEIRALPQNPESVAPRWKKDMAQRYDPEMCARPPVGDLVLTCPSTTGDEGSSARPGYLLSSR